MFIYQWYKWSFSSVSWLPLDIKWTTLYCYQFYLHTSSKHDHFHGLSSAKVGLSILMHMHRFIQQSCCRFALYSMKSTGRLLSVVTSIRFDDSIKILIKILNLIDDLPNTMFHQKDLNSKYDLLCNYTIIWICLQMF